MKCRKRISGISKACSRRKPPGKRHSPKPMRRWRRWPNTRARLGSSAKTLLAALQARETIGNRCAVGRAVQRHDGRGRHTNQDNLARDDRSGGLWPAGARRRPSIEPEILAIAPETLEQFITGRAGPGPLRALLRQLGLLRGHVRSAEVEALLAEVGGRATSAVPDPQRPGRRRPEVRRRSRTSDGQEVELAQGNCLRLLTSAETAPCARRPGRPTPTAT